MEALSPAADRAAPAAHAVSADPGVRRRALVLASRELLWMSRTWWLLGSLVLVAELASGSVSSLSPLHAVSSVVIFGLAAGGAVASRTIGLRTPPEIRYSQIFDRSAPPPDGAELELEGRTASRAGWAAIATGVGLAVAASLSLAVVFLLAAEPPETVLAGLPPVGGLVASGWMLVCAACARTLSRWFSRWEGRRQRWLLCAPLSSGRMAYVYFTRPRSG